MKRRFHLARSADIARVKRLGNTFSHPLCILISMPNSKAYNRIAVIAGRSVGNACERNRAKRRIRACLDALFTSIKPGWDLIFYARQKLGLTGFNEIKQAVQELLSDADLILMENHNVY